MTNSFTASRALASPEPPQPLNPTPNRRPFPSPTPHISIRQAAQVPMLQAQGLDPKTAA